MLSQETVINVAAAKCPNIWLFDKQGVDNPFVGCLFEQHVFATNCNGQAVCFVLANGGVVTRSLSSLNSCFPPLENPPCSAQTSRICALVQALAVVAKHMTCLCI